MRGWIKLAKVLSVAMLVASVVCLAYVSAQITISGQDNGRVINLQNLPTAITGGNVSSVSSGDGCIFVSPTTGNVIITFNTSCGSGSSIYSYNHTAIVLYSNQTFEGTTTFRDTSNTGTPGLVVASFAGSPFWSFYHNVFGAGFNASLCSGPCAVATDDLSAGFTLGGGIVSLQGTLIAGSGSITTLSGTSVTYTNAQFQSTNTTDLNTTRLNVGQNGTIKNLSVSGTLFGNLLSNGSLKTDLDYAFNGTGVFANNLSLVIPHQTYDITGTTSFDTAYSNNLDRPILLSVTFDSVVITLSDIAYAEIQSGGGTKCSQEGIIVGVTNKPDFQTFHNMVCVVQPGFAWNIVTATAGTGAVNLDVVEITAL